MSAQIIKKDRAGWFEGTSIDCAPLPGERHRSWRLVLLGPPGVGKGTQGDLLSRRLEICHLSTGDLFRAAGSHRECDQTPKMAEAMECMRRGDLVPDSTVWEMVRERGDCIRCRGGFLLDGFPRTLHQAEQLNQFTENEKISLSAVVDYEMPFAEIVMRLSGRRICEKCKSVFHITWRPPRAEGVCDDCGGGLFRREDDNAASITIRLETYRRTISPLIQFYKNLGLLTPVDAVGTAEEVFARTLEALQGRA